MPEEFKAFLDELAAGLRTPRIPDEPPPVAKRPKRARNRIPRHEKTEFGWRRESLIRAARSVAIPRPMKRTSEMFWLFYQHWATGLTERDIARLLPHWPRGTIACNRWRLNRRRLIACRGTVRVHTQRCGERSARVYGLTDSGMTMAEIAKVGFRTDLQLGSFSFLAR